MIQKIGQVISDTINKVGEFSVLLGLVIYKTFSGKRNRKNIIEQAYNIGIKSLPITLMTSAFVGMAFAMQIVNELIKYGAAPLVGGIIGLAVFRELGPLFTGVVVAGRIGAGISAELGTMKVTEQIDALESMAQDPIDYLIVPRFIACILMLPLLTMMANLCGITFGYLIAVGSGHVNSQNYIDSARTLVTMTDILGGLLKSMIFGIIISIISSMNGFNTNGGAKDVGLKTTSAVVMSLITIFVLNYFLSLGLF